MSSTTNRNKGIIDPVAFADNMAMISQLPVDSEARKALTKYFLNINKGYTRICQLTSYLENGLQEGDYYKAASARNLVEYTKEDAISEISASKQFITRTIVGMNTLFVRLHGRPFLTCRLKKVGVDKNGYPVYGHDGVNRVSIGYIDLPRVIFVKEGHDVNDAILYMELNGI